MRTYGLHLTRAWRAMPNQKIFDWRISFLLLLLVFSTAQLRAQVVINEILPNGTVELKNLGSSTVNVGTYWLCDFPTYEQIQNSNITCGNMMLGPGEILAVDDFNTLNNNDGEMGLYTTNAFNNSSAIIDYVEWGFSGHQRSSVAVAAGIWTTGDFVPAFATGESLEYSGMGNNSTDWTAVATPSICNENGGGAPQVDEVVINEILPNGTVEIKNIGSTTVDVSTYWLCDFPTYAQIQNSNVICGNMMLAPGEILAVDDFNTIDNNDGEMGLYTTNNFGSSTAIVDYVEWGFTGHGRSSVAVAAGIWTTGDFVPAFGTGESLEYSGTGNNSTDWAATATPTICNENMGGGNTCTVDGGDITFSNGTLNTSICVDGNPDPLNVVFSNNSTGTSTGWIITDDSNNILALPQSPPFDLDGAGVGTCIIWHIGYEPNSGFGGNVVGNNLADLTGCFDLSNGLTVYREAADGGTVSLSDGTNSTSICVDGNADPLGVVHTTNAPNLTYDYVITDDNDIILAFAPNGPIDLDGAGVGTKVKNSKSYNVTTAENARTANRQYCILASTVLIWSK